MALNGNFMDDQLDIMCEGFFDNIDDLLDFSIDDQPLGMSDSGNSLLDIPLPAQFSVPDSKDCRIAPNSQETKIGNDIGIDEDWISDFLYDSNLDAEIKKSGSVFQSFSPTSVLEPTNNTTENALISSSASSSASSHAMPPPPSGTMKLPVPARARSKRPRRPIIPILPPTDGPPSIPTILPITSEIEPSPPKRIKIIQRPNLTDLNPNVDGVRKCMHCGIHKTPQWRAGPMGPKTLCNACGVRYKSGRLFPEYRPAASPTFVPSVHSNSHKKVVEMRNKVIEHKVAKEYNPAAKNCDLLKYIRV